MLTGKRWIRILSDNMKVCEECKHFIPLSEEGKCDIYGIPNHGISYCQDWEKIERGYL